MLTCDEIKNILLFDDSSPPLPQTIINLTKILGTMNTAIINLRVTVQSLHAALIKYLNCCRMHGAECIRVGKMHHCGIGDQRGEGHHSGSSAFIICSVDASVWYVSRCTTVQGWVRTPEWHGCTIEQSGCTSVRCRPPIAPEGRLALRCRWNSVCPFSAGHSLLLC